MGVAVSNSNAARVACASDETVPQSVPVDLVISAKCRSEWQDLNLRPPRLERGVLPATLLTLLPGRDQEKAEAGNAVAAGALAGISSFSCYSHELSPSWR